MMWMKNEPTTNPPKKQKGFQLPLEVIEWLDDEETRTGATLSRIALAAFCAYLQSNERNNMMRMAMAVERGQVQFRYVKSESIGWAIEAVKSTLSDEASKQGQKSLKTTLERLKRERLRLQSRGR